MERLIKLIESNNHIHSWAEVGLIEDAMKYKGFEIITGDRDNYTDGEYHKIFKYGKYSFTLHANCWDGKSFLPLAEFIRSIS